MGGREGDGLILRASSRTREGWSYTPIATIIDRGESVCQYGSEEGETLIVSTLKIFDGDVCLEELTEPRQQQMRTPRENSKGNEQLYQGQLGPFIRCKRVLLLLSAVGVVVAERCGTAKSCDLISSMGTYVLIGFVNFSRRFVYVHTEEAALCQPKRVTLLNPLSLPLN